MESLLCNEVWLMSPAVVENDKLLGNEICHVTAMEDHEQTFGHLFDKEVVYMPERGYSKHIESNSLIGGARFKAIHWLIRSQRRLNLSLEPVFCAANYLDRFISLKQCQGWQHWMFELLVIACLSVASKFNENTHFPLHEIQGLEHSFESCLIQRMELILLKALEWRLGPTTSYSYVEVLTRSDDSHYSLNTNLIETLTERVSQLLLQALLDSKFVDFRPCVVAMSAVEHLSKELFSSQNDPYLARFRALIPRHQKDDLSKCYKMMDEYNLTLESIYTYPSSPVTVLASEPYDFCDFQVDLSLLKIQRVELNLASRKKRKMEEQESST